MRWLWLLLFVPVLAFGGSKDTTYATGWNDENCGITANNISNVTALDGQYMTMTWNEGDGDDGDGFGACFDLNPISHFGLGNAVGTKWWGTLYIVAHASEAGVGYVKFGLDGPSPFNSSIQPYSQALFIGDTDKLDSVSLDPYVAFEGFSAGAMPGFQWSSGSGTIFVDQMWAVVHYEEPGNPWVLHDTTISAHWLSGGDVSYTNPGNVDVKDGSYATVTLPSAGCHSGGTTGYLISDGYLNAGARTDSSYLDSVFIGAYGHDDGAPHTGIGNPKDVYPSLNLLNDKNPTLQVNSFQTTDSYVESGGGVSQWQYFPTVSDIDHAQVICYPECGNAKTHTYSIDYGYMRAVWWQPPGNPTPPIQARTKHFHWW